MNGLELLPNEILLKIVRCLTAVSNPNEIKGATHRLYALGGVNRRLYAIVKDYFESGEFVKTFLNRYGSLGRISYRKPFILGVSKSNSLNVDLKELRVGFKKYLDTPNNRFSKLLSLDRKIDRFTSELFERAKELFQGESFFPSIPKKIGNFILLQNQ